MIKVVQLGLGPIGQQLTHYLTERKGIQIVAAVDPDPAKTGKDLGELAGLSKMGIPISSDLPSAMKRQEADVAVISTVSSLQKVESQIKEAADFKLNIVSTCEELSYPFKTQPEIAGRINGYCSENGVSCIGTGVNPGFLMDYLPAVLSSVCRKVDHVKVERVQDARHRRIPFQQKIGAGLTKEEFKAKENSIRHVGLTESVYLLAHALNWELDRVDEVLTPIIAESKIELENTTINKGNVAGVQQVAKGYMNDKELISLVFKAAAGLNHSYDSIEITGEPGIRSTIEGGVNGDVATSAIIVNTIRSIVNMKAGLKTMLDIPTPAYFSRIE